MRPEEKLTDVLSGAKRPVILSHVYPDGDAIGSELGLYHALTRHGARPTILNTHRAPILQDLLDPAGLIQVVTEQRPSDQQLKRLASADLCVIVDACEVDRLGCLAMPVFESSAFKVCIDHHLCRDPGSFDLIWSVPDAPATGELICAVARALGVTLDREIAEPLFVALATDTGWFRHANTSSRAFGLAAELVGAGADPGRIHSALFENSSLARTQALGEMLRGLVAAADPRVIYGVVSRAKLEGQGVRVEEIDGFVDSLKDVRGVEILALFVEVSPGRYKVSLRSKGDQDVHDLAVQFGGGGHAKAAGFRIEGDPEAVVGRVVDAAVAKLTAATRA